MIDADTFHSLLGASPFVVFGIVLIILIRAMPSILSEYRKVEESRSDGLKQVAEAQAKVVESGTNAVEIAVKSMQETQQQSRIFYVDKLEDMRSGMSLLEDRVRTLENEVENKDRRISDLERENQELRDDNQTLHKEIDTLRGKLLRVSRGQTADRKRNAKT